MFYCICNTILYKHNNERYTLISKDSFKSKGRVTHAILISQVLFFQCREQPFLIPCLKITYASRLLVILGSCDTDSLIKACLALTFNYVDVGTSGFGFERSFALGLPQILIQMYFIYLSCLFVCILFYFQIYKQVKKQQKQAK